MAPSSDIKVPRLNRATIMTVAPSLLLPHMLKKLDLRCFLGKLLSNWLKPSEQKNLKGLYTRAWKLNTLDNEENHTWNVKVLHFKFLKDMKIEWSELLKAFPYLAYVEKIDYPKLNSFPKNGKYLVGVTIRLGREQFILTHWYYRDARAPNTSLCASKLGRTRRGMVYLGKESSTEGSAAIPPCTIPVEWGGSHDHEAYTSVLRDLGAEAREDFIVQGRVPENVAHETIISGRERGTFKSFWPYPSEWRFPDLLAKYESIEIRMEYLDVVNE
ncbi:hypothetical protein GIB67_001763 [Kingdonia uniflora]|uniref:Uncharacterized protein n=1 Tax=Kingdonia uniflora TaxID=39325 RepID=A0A7J7LBU1_9MAGN|nr:hypothetical protein GIB67_001763 [Kingdonia uniflora]